MAGRVERSRSPQRFLYLNYVTEVDHSVGLRCVSERAAGSREEGFQAGAAAGASASGRGRVSCSQGVFVQPASSRQGTQGRKLLFQEGKLPCRSTAFLRGDQVERNAR